MNSARRLVTSTFWLVLSVACCSTASATQLLGLTAETFAVLGAAGVSVNGADFTTINGNVGSYPTNTLSGFPSPGQITGGIATDLATAQAARGDALAAYNFLAGQSVTSNYTGIDLGTLTLTQGVYKWDDSAQLTGTLTLDALGNDNAVFIFLIGSTLTTASSSEVSVINGGPNDGIFWQIGSSATLGDSTSFVGNILADTSISLNPFAQIVCGRALAGINKDSGAVTMADRNHVAINDGSGCVGGYGGGYESIPGGGFQRVNGGNAVGVPEPSSLALLVAGLAGLAMVCRRRKSA